MNRFLVTGGAGFIGSHVVERLVSEGHEVRVLDNLSSGSLDNLETVGTQVEICVGDIMDPIVCRRAMQGVTHVIHLAALTSVRQSMIDPGPTHEINGQGTLNLLNAAYLQDVQGFAFASSASVYGNTEQMPISEETELSPLSPYAASKLEGERQCHMYREEYGLPTSILRFFNVYGPRQSATSEYASVIPKFIEKCMSLKSPTVFGDGEQSRDFIYVGDVATALIRSALHARKIPGPFNVCTGRSTSLNFLLNELSWALGAQTIPTYVGSVPGDIRHSKGDPAALAKALLKSLNSNLRLTDLSQGLEKTITWYREKCQTPATANPVVVPLSQPQRAAAYHH